MLFSATIAVTFIFLAGNIHCRGALILSLNGNENIPTDGSGRVLVTDIGQNNFNSLHCQSTHATSTFSSDWYYHPTSLSLNPRDRIIVDDEREQGWTRTRDVNNGIVRLLHDQDIPRPLEGIFTCEIEEDPDSPIFLGIYYPITIDIHVEVISARMGTFIVTCTAKGGTILRGSLSGPFEMNYTLQLVGTKHMRGDDTYSVSTGAKVGPVNGDTYTCIATNRAGGQLSANVDPSDTERLKVASPPVIEIAEQTSTNSARVEWSQPQEGATVTGYVVHYSDGITERSLRLSALVFSANITQLGRNRAYTIVVEATSSQLSGLSYTINLLITDEQPAINNSTRSTGNPMPVTIIIVATGAVVTVTLILVTTISVSTAAVLIRRSKGRPKPRGTAKTLSRLDVEDMVSNSAYNSTAQQTNHLPFNLSKLTKEPIYDLPKY